MASIFTKFFGRTVSEAAGVAAGIAVASPLRPVVQAVENETWKLHPDKPVPATLAAAIVAEDVAAQPWGEDQAASTGFSADAFEKMLGEALNAPGVPQLLTLWRRGEIGDADFLHGLRKAKLEGRWDAPLRALLTDRLDPAIIATAIQRGIMRDPGFLPVGPPTGTGNVAAFPVSPLDPIAEAKAAGIDADRLFVETAIVGLPLALVQAAQAYFRGIITLDDFKRAVAEGNTRNEWGDAALEVSRQILTSSEYCELELRGYLTRAQRLAETRKHGMSDADSDHLFDVLGRSINVHQIVTAEARGGVYGGPSDQIPVEFLRSLQRGNLRPEYYNLAYANRYSYPSAFVIRGLLTGGALSADQGHELFLQIGWPPALARQVADFYGAGTTSAGDKHVGKAQVQLWTTTHRSYVAGEADDATATTALEAAGVAVAAVPQVLALWQQEIALRRKQLTPAQVKKAYRGAITNQDTGLPYTRDDALAALLERGYSTAQANEFLDL